MAFSSFDRRLLDEGLNWFEQPRLASLLELLGTSRFERVEALATMLRHSSTEEFEEALTVFERAVTRVERERDESDRNARRRRDRDARDRRRRSA
jgi:hypothetical protein